jgi:S1-C subfamily serine protease
VLSFALAACQLAQQPPPPQAVASTPAKDLNISYRQGSSPTAVPQGVIDAADAEYLLLTNIYERLTPSVVNIEVTGGQDVHGDSGRGSGFVHDLNGHIITNAHVVQDAQRIEVTFNDGYLAEAKIVGADVFSDVAVIKVTVDASHLYPVTFGDSDQIKVGQRAIVIGNPFGLASSMTVGIVSGLGRQLPSAEMLSNTVMPGFQNPAIIQVDADINPGNSGGPLLNSRGEVIGINTAIRTDTGVSQGVGFAVPSRTIQRVAPQLMKEGRVNYPWIGITSLSAEDGLGVPALAEPLKLPVKAGVMIESVAPNSPAAKAGLKGGDRLTRVRGRDVCTGGDIIVAVNSKFITNMDQLLSYLVLETAPGDSVKLLVIRGPDTFEVPVLLEARPTDGASVNVGGCGS